MNFVLLPAIIGSDTCENRLSFFVLCMLAFEKVIKIKPTLILIYDRVEYVMVPGSIQTMIATHITDNNINTSYEAFPEWSSTYLKRIQGKAEVCI